jgi:hypothetical protein
LSDQAATKASGDVFGVLIPLAENPKLTAVDNRVEIVFQEIERRLIVVKIDAWADVNLATWSNGMDPK